MDPIIDYPKFNCYSSSKDSRITFDITIRTCPVRPLAHYHPSERGQVISAREIPSLQTSQQAVHTPSCSIWPKQASAMVLRRTTRATRPVDGRLLLPAISQVMASFSNKNNLGHYVTKHHPEQKLVTSKGGRSSKTAEDAGIAFYEMVMKSFEEARAAAPKPLLPTKKDGTINGAEMRRQVRDTGYAIPCDECKAKKQAKSK
ncbi:uncharacterized protein APUU_40840A [Aspergillus puulaauensis]|uniref:Uncharacterized protein n=1 Tax=Aspergillus puulaauensis TaxID=1220207 RepID=A0A7R7XMS1_9EURO|nr:uncharacterized protein APUU_40840A [Aspergillus puulaauensis]BCS24396.1 hypothetical protein APUU_40840A [Aspergillus puulaauensis]